MGKTVVTKHGAKRVKERGGVGRKGSVRLADRAFTLGLDRMEL